MYQLLIYGSEDPFSYEPIRLQTYATSETEGVAMMKVNSYREHFAQGRLSSIHIVLQKITHDESGQIEVLLNEYGQHPLKVRVVINPEALEVKMAKTGKPVKKVSLATPVEVSY